jgi:hypothetical protein
MKKTYSNNRSIGNNDKIKNILIDIFYKNFEILNPDYFRKQFTVSNNDNLRANLEALSIKVSKRI